MMLAVETAATTLGDAEHLVHLLDGVLGALPGAATHEVDPYVVSTHVVREPAPHFVLVLQPAEGPDRTAAPDSEQVREAAARVAEALPGAPVTTSSPALAEALTRTGGRLARYPGRARIERPTTVAAVLAGSPVEEVAGLAGVRVTRDSPLDLTGYARPVWREGRCVLLVQQSVDGLIPFEVRAQVPCCSAH